MRCRAILTLVAVLVAAVLPAQTRLLRFPDVAGDRLVFCHGGDLWTASTEGGVAVRLTAHPGLELFPKFSPDGQWIAFTGQYDGDEQVYVMPARGGEPRQLTWYPARGPLPQRWGFDNQVYGWSRDGSSVLFRSMRAGWDLTDTRLYYVAASGGMPTALPMPVAGGGDVSPDGTKAVYSPLTRDFRTWKRYEGGWAQDLYVFDFATSAVTPVSHSPRTERDSMWIGDEVWFVSDRDGTLNLFRHDLAKNTTAQVTDSKTWDVRWASRSDDGQIVYELGGDLRVLDTKTGTTKEPKIEVPSDGVHARPESVSVSGNIEGYSLSPKAERAVIVARGDVFTAPIEKGITRNLTATPGAHERLAVWSPDGKKVAFVSDASGEEQIHWMDQDGKSPAESTTAFTRRIRHIEWAPDSQKIAVADVSGRLYILEIASKNLREVAKDAGGRIGDLTWAPDSRWIAMSLGEPTELRSIWILALEDGRLERVTPLEFNEFEPVWDRDGQYLFFFADRSYAPQIAGFEWNVVPARNTGLFVLALRKDVPHPFPPESDEVKPAEADKKDDKPADDKKEEPKDTGVKPITIDFEGIERRVARVPVDADNLRNLSATVDGLLFIRSGDSFYGREDDRPAELVHFDRKKREVSVLVERLGGGYAISADGTKVMVRDGGSFALYDAKHDAKGSKKSVATDGLRLERNPRAEWNAVFHEAWRRFRDHFYAANMHGYDWNKLRERYAALLPSVGHRSDLNYLLGEMVAELNVSHAYVSGGDWQTPDRAPVALLGAELGFDPATKLYRIQRILSGQNEEDRYRSPLTEIGVDVAEGTYLFAIDGQDLVADQDPYRHLRNKADRPVELLVGATPDRAAARRVTIRPIRGESDLRYLSFVVRNRARVSELSGGRLGYIHIPDMSEDGISEFIKWYYGQVRKEGLVVDVRNNGGGNVSQIILERLRRVLLATEFSRHSEFTGTYPSVVFTGPMVCLLNENSASDGDIFPWMFRQAKLGPLIGKRSWGGVVGITDHGPLLDGGSVNVPEYGHADAKGVWAVEGHGVDPDIVVDNDPASVIAGKDPQLERGVAYLLEELTKRSAALPPRPADPVK